MKGAEERARQYDREWDVGVEGTAKLMSLLREHEADVRADERAKSASVDTAEIAHSAERLQWQRATGCVDPDTAAAALARICALLEKTPTEGIPDAIERIRRERDKTQADAKALRETVAMFRVLLAPNKKKHMNHRARISLLSTLTLLVAGSRIAGLLDESLPLETPRPQPKHPETGRDRTERRRRAQRIAESTGLGVAAVYRALGRGDSESAIRARAATAKRIAESLPMKFTDVYCHLDAGRSEDQIDAACKINAAWGPVIDPSDLDRIARAR